MSWHIYFVSKLFMALQDRLPLHGWMNLPLALLAYWPLEQRRWRVLRALAAWPLALTLLAWESGIALNGRLLHQLQQLAGFSWSYTMELLLRLLEDTALPMLVAVLVFCTWLNRWLRLDVLLCLALLVVPLAGIWPTVNGPMASRTVDAVVSQDSGSTDPQARVQAFWQGESQRALAFAQDRRPPFDVVLLHICSLSWDDLEAMGMDGKNLLARFHLVFEQFNTVTSYSGPSMLRLMRSNCGQIPHESLYRPPTSRCGLLQQLHLAGYEVNAHFNHDGRFDGFADIFQSETGVPIRAPVYGPGAPAALKGFDGSPIAGDHATLNAWRSRIAASAPPQALYYNSLTLHDGNRLPGDAPVDMMSSYRQRLANLLRDLDRFIGDVEQSKRPTLVVLLPEHGAALRKGAQHIAGLRETPWPEITLVPVAVRLVGMDAQRPTGVAFPIQVSGPTSYLSFAALLADLLAQPDPWTVLQQAPTALPRVAFVADNGESVVTLDQESMWLRSASSGWQRMERPAKSSQKTNMEEP